ncbi:uncharacterized protein LOC133712170 [Rosa rugosa]|uniref:uncharacterized protein LOC133712170 n=1 Tax=Rosa rugosa TaxID=74645 RepID=UPI002B4020B4|nr:uncharacterized protein LOC133712170 [Rosa rugosa]
MGVIIRNHRGFSIAGDSFHSSHNSTIEVEADAVVKGLQLAAHMKIQNIILESDCQEVIRALDNTEFCPNWRISPMIDKVNHLKPLFNGIKWKLAKLRLCSQDWANRPPTSLISILRNDGLPGPPSSTSDRVF